MLRAFTQLALDLFGGASAAASPPSAPQAPSAPGPGPAGRRSPRPGGRRLRPIRARDGGPPADVASDAAPPGPAQPAVPIGELLSPAQFSHPQANREILLDTHRVGYLLRRSRRRSIGFLVGMEGLTVSAPRWVSVGEIEDGLRERAGWVLRKLEEQRQRAQRLQAQQIDWRDGVSIQFLGEPVIIVLDPRHAFDGTAQLNTDAQALPGVPRLTLHVGLPQHAQPAQIRDAVQAWLMRQARRVFEQRLQHFAPALGVRWTRLALSSAGTRWGSARADGAIRLNWRLIHFRLPVIDYVVAHELSHLRVMDHSPRFWDTVASVMPDYPQWRAELREDAIPRWD